MDWIKRNLYFFIGSVAAVVLMGLAGYYLYSKWDLNNEIMKKLNDDYEALQRLSTARPHPGSGEVNNIETAKKQRQELLEFIRKAERHFQRIPGIPDSTNVSSQEFTAALRGTIYDLQKLATNSSVTLQPDYSFSFAAQKPRVTFAQGSLEPLSVQVGEVKAICAVLFDAKINSLDNIRRERVSADDSNGPLTDYLDQKSVTNDLAILTPYEITFRCFSSELAGVLAGLAGSPHGLLVKKINVEPAPAATPGIDPSTGLPMTETTAAVPTPVAAPTAEADGAAAFMRRYGIGPRGPEGPYRMPMPTYTPPQPQANKGGLPTVLDEKQLKVTLLVDVIKMLPRK